MMLADTHILVKKLLPPTLESMNSEPGEGIGPYIKRLRERAGISQVELARSAGMSRAYLSQLEEKKEAVPAPDLRRRIAKRLGTTNIALLIAAGQIEPSEVDPAASSPPPFPDDDLRAEVVQDLRQLTTIELIEHARETVRFLVRAQQGAPMP